MAKDSKDISKRPATTPEAQEKRNIALANQLAEKQLRDGTASSQIISHYLKLGSPKEQLEIEKAQEELKLIKAKTEAYQNGKNIEELYAKAITAMMTYKGDVVDD